MRIDIKTDFIDKLNSAQRGHFQLDQTRTEPLLYNLWLCQKDECGTHKSLIAQAPFYDVQAICNALFNYFQFNT